MRISDPQYVTNILRLPLMSFVFNEIDFQKALKENSRYMRTKKKSSKKQLPESEKNVFSLAKPKKGEVTLTITARMTKMDGSYKIVKAEELMKNFEDIHYELKPLK